MNTNNLQNGSNLNHSNNNNNNHIDSVHGDDQKEEHNDNDPDPLSVPVAPSEISSFVAACRLLIHGQNDEERRRGESALLAVKERASPFALCLSVVDRCTPSEPEVAFQAMTLMAGSVLTEWHNVPESVVEALRRRLLSLMMSRRTHSGNGVVLRSMAKTVAILFKRKWRSEDAVASRYGGSRTSGGSRSELDRFNKESICGSMVAVVEPLLASNDPSAAALGLMLCSELIAQFSANGASSALGLSADFHIECHRGFERWALQKLFVLTLKLMDRMRADMVSRSGSTGQFAPNRKSRILGALRMEQQSGGHLVAQSVAEMVSRAAVVAEECLSFDFHEKTSDDELLLSFSRSIGAEATPFPRGLGRRRAVRPGSPWRRCLVESDLVTTLAAMHRAIHCHLAEVHAATSPSTSTSPSPSPATAATLRATLHILREALCHLSSLSGHCLDYVDPLSARGDDEGDGHGDDDGDECTASGPRRIRFQLGAQVLFDRNLCAEQRVKGGCLLTLGQAQGRSGGRGQQSGRRRLSGSKLLLRRLPFLRKLALCFKRWLMPLIAVKAVNAVPMDSSLLLDLCRMLSALTTNFRHEILWAISESEWTEQGLFAALRGLGTLLISKMTAPSTQRTETWVDEAFDIVVEAVVSLIACYELRKRRYAVTAFADSADPPFTLSVVGALCPQPQGTEWSH